MKGRDLAIVAAVVLLGGFALADSLRTRVGETAEPTAEPALETSRADRPEAEPEAPPGWPAGRIQGTLVFTDADDCSVRVIGLVGGRERRPRDGLVGTCEFWTAPLGEKIAYGIGGGTRREAPRMFSIVDLIEPSRELGTFGGLVGDLAWSPDARRIAWCDANHAGLEFEIGAMRLRRISRCPITYDPEGRLVFAVGRRLVTETHRILIAEEPIVEAVWGRDESLLVVLAGGLVRRYGASGGVRTSELFSDREIAPSRDNCGVLFEEQGRIHLVDLGCFAGDPTVFFGHDAAWSPDGRWVAIADRTQITFHQVVGGDDFFAWPARAVEIYWRSEN